VKISFIYVWILAVVCLGITNANLLPEYDKRCGFMMSTHAKVYPHIYEEQKNYFEKEVPLKVHQIWFGDQRNKNVISTNTWKEYCETFSYEYKLWSEKDLPLIKIVANPINFRWIEDFLAKKLYHSASDIARMEILYHYGGIYVDCDFYAPKTTNRIQNKYIDFRVLTPMRGLTVVTEHHGRNIGETAIFVCNGIVFSCPRHPVIKSMLNQFGMNIEGFRNTKYQDDAMFITGPFMFNRVLFGSYTVIPISYLKEFGMY
jgi:inositol phosphorylceramide mannosyltransferase catalytic subunit